jgi:hypothetical protein
MIVKYKEVKMDEFFRRKIIGIECGCNLDGNKLKMQQYLYNIGKIAELERDAYERIEEFLKEE